jgi:lysozyme
MRNVSEQGLALIRQFEGFSAKPYLCPAGKPTIGYGHLIKNGDFPGEISKIEAEKLLKQDVMVAESAIFQLVKVELTQNQLDALVSFIYNIGTKAFEKSTLLRKINEKKPEEAAGQFSRWVYGNGRKLPGLIARRAAESKLFSEISS